MSTTIPQASTPAADAPLAASAQRRRRPLVLAAALLVVACAGAALVISEPFGERRSAQPTASTGAGQTALASVREGPLSSQVNASGTLQYAARHDGSA